MASGLRYVGPVLVGVALGWFVARTLTTGGPPPTTAECPQPVAVQKPSHEPHEALPTPSAPPLAPVVPPLRELLAKLKIAEVRNICLEVERNFQKTAIDSYAIALNDLPKNVRDQELTALSRLFSATAEKDLFWRSEFSLEVGQDVIAFEVFLDLQSNTEPESQCATWTVFYELNGRVSADSLLGASACDGNGYRKKGTEYYVDLTLYDIPALARAVTSLLMPFPGGLGRAEYLDAEGKTWRPLPRAGWVRSTGAEFLNKQKKYQEKLENVSDSP